MPEVSTDRHRRSIASHHRRKRCHGHPRSGGAPSHQSFEVSCNRHPTPRPGWNRRWKNIGWGYTSSPSAPGSKLTDDSCRRKLELDPHSSLPHRPQPPLYPWQNAPPLPPPQRDDRATNRADSYTGDSPYPLFPGPAVDVGGERQRGEEETGESYSPVTPPPLPGRGSRRELCLWPRYKTT
jgi:hypothetical protein